MAMTDGGLVASPHLIGSSVNGVLAQLQAALDASGYGIRTACGFGRDE
jgi:hypothetical protein